MSLQKRRKSTWQNKNDFQCFPHQAAPAERSWRGVLRGHVPSKSLSADSETPCALASGRTGKVGEKSDSFSRAERTRPLRPVSRLQLLDFENIPVECFQRIFSLLKSADTARRVPTNALKHHEKILHPLCFLLNRRTPNHILHRTPCAGIFLFEKMLPPADFFEKTLAISFWLCYNTSI